MTRYEDGVRIERSIDFFSFTSCMRRGQLELRRAGFTPARLYDGTYVPDTFPHLETLHLHLWSGTCHASIYFCFCYVTTFPVDSNPPIPRRMEYNPPLIVVNWRRALGSTLRASFDQGGLRLQYHDASIMELIDDNGKRLAENTGCWSWDAAITSNIDIKSWWDLLWNTPFLLILRLDLVLWILKGRSRSVRCRIGSACVGRFYLRISF